MTKEFLLSKSVSKKSFLSKKETIQTKLFYSQEKRSDKESQFKMKLVGTTVLSEVIPAVYSDQNERIA